VDAQWTDTGLGHLRTTMSLTGWDSHRAGDTIRAPANEHGPLSVRSRARPVPLGGSHARAPGSARLCERYNPEVSGMSITAEPEEERPTNAQPNYMHHRHQAKM